MPKRTITLKIGQRVLEAIGVICIACMYCAAVMRLGADTVILSTAVGAIVYLITRKHYKR